MSELDATHDPALRSWVASANAADTEFPIQNLPFGRFRRGSAAWRIGIAIGDQVLDLNRAAGTSVWPTDLRPLLAPLAEGDLNAFMALGAAARQTLRRALSPALAEGSAAQAALAPCLVPQAEIELGVPCRIGDYTDFYVGIHHATAVGRLFRPDNPLLPNYKWVPIGYHGRASTILASGQPFVRPQGQLMPPGAAQPTLGPTRRLDFELELGVFIGTGNAIGHPIALDEAESHVFGLALFNDWSARDVQAWEYQPLGPFLSKNFASTVSPWIVTMEALAPFRRPFVRAEGDPAPLPYLDGAAHRAGGAIDVTLEVLLQTPRMREAGLPAQRISRSNFADAAYWSVAQMVAHHTVNGCALAGGDLFGTGTLSGPQPDQAGSLLELTQGGKQPISLANGEQRTFLEDGDRLSLAGRCSRAGFRSIGFGPCESTVLPTAGRDARTGGTHA
ncbi:MAG: fumarylacetoacetase [Piscinibacter sp.]|uniref:fumarylacetoacetase n=1 Tax=Piscinibacter sp. TaxID=1903157 RepID=UPI002583FF2A|nr:fumarylacetoacetase [Piscinibacter sp.]MCW5663245.1 fumarylacetoacetase [Piscinibacter sp.]